MTIQKDITLMKTVRALLVEDDPIAMMVNCKMIEKFNCNFDSAMTGSLALEMACINSYDIILMDVGLPDMDGITVTEKIRGDEKVRQLRKSAIFILTAYSIAEVYTRCIKAGVNDVFNKPISLVTLKNIFQNSV